MNNISSFNDHHCHSLDEVRHRSAFKLRGKPHSFESLAEHVANIRQPGIPVLFSCLRSHRCQVDPPLSEGRFGWLARSLVSSTSSPGYHIAQTTGLSRATVSRILRRLGLNRMRDLEPAVPLIRYEHPAPGDLLHLDIKQLGRFAGVVSRPDGRRRGTLHRGWEYVHVAIDDHSRIAFTQILPRFDAACAIAFLRASVAYYANLGIALYYFWIQKSS